jgi:vacuolar-type H+-ATPase subunit F/Vma7
MYKMVVITDNRTADGFRLAGVEVKVAESVASAQRSVIEMMSDETVGIIALDGRLSSAIDERIDRKLSTIYRPLLIMLPLGETIDTQAVAQKRLSRLIRKAIGFDVTLKRGP